jgi:hypothetical protein
MLGVLIIGLILPGPAFAKDDIKLVAELSAELHQMAQTREKKVSDKLLARTTRLLMERTRRLLKEQGLQAVLDRFSGEIHDEVEDYARGVLGSTNFKRGNEANRAQKAQETLIRLTTDSPLSNVIANWMGVPPLGALTFPEGDAAEWSLPLPLDDVKATAPSTSGPSIEELTIVNERGGAGEGNGHADPGEWVLFNVVLQNKSKHAWFSTSAFLNTSNKSCILVQRGERELTEMDPEGQASFSFWTYFGHDCAASKARTLFIDLQDTHHPRKRRLELSFSMPHRGIPAPRVENALLDADVPGSSDGSGTHIASADRRLEFSHGIRVGSPRTLAARVRYALPKDQASVISSWHHRHPDMIPDGGQVFAPGDDVDFLMEDQPTITKAQKKYGKSRRWFNTNRKIGTLWVAADLETWVGNRSQNSSGSEPSTPQTLPTAEGILNLVNKHMEFVSREVSPSHPDAIAGVAGHDVVIDREKFLAAYQALLAGEPLTPAPRAARYLQRLYIPVQMARYQERVVERKEANEPYEPIFRLDLGVGASIFSNIQPILNDVWEDKTTVALSFEGRISVGRRFTGIIEVFNGSGETAGTYSTVQFEETALGLGIGYIIPLGTSLELHPRVLFAASTRTADAGDFFVKEEKAFGVEAGLTMRYWFNSWLGAHLDAAYLMTNDAPSYGDEDLMSGMAPRFSGGLSTLF